jgi:hypothetical protein
MFISCHLPNKNDEIFLLYDKEDFSVEELGLNLEDVQVIESSKIMSEYDEFPILNLNDFLLRGLKHNARTDTHILGEAGIDTLYQLIHEKLLIEQKKSNLSRSKRDIVLKRYNDIMKCLTI